MSTPPAGISEADWETWPAGARELILSQHEEIEQLRSQLTALASELANLRERIGRSSRNSSKPPSSDGLGFKPPDRAIPDRGRNCCRSSGWMRWWITTLMPAAAAVSCWTVLIQIHCVIR